MQTQKEYPRNFSIEFFPPRTEQGAAKLRDVWTRLARLEPRYFSVTFGAGGSTRDGTFETVKAIMEDVNVPAAPHLSCVGSTRTNIREIIEQYRASGIRHLVALRGDLPSGTRDAGEFRYANELVEFIRAETGDHFHIEVGCYPEVHPQADSYDHDLANFQRKMEAGANAAITQYFFNADAYFRFVDACERRGIDAPIVPGIMLITNFRQLARFSDACGAEIPRWLRKRLEAYADDRESIIEFGAEFVTDMSARLLEAGAPGLHFYSMNQAPLVERIWHDLGLSNSR